MSDSAIPHPAISTEEIERIENDLYARVLRRLVRTVLIAVVVFVVAVGGIGWLTWTALRKRLAEDAVQVLQNDEGLHAELLGAIDVDTAAISARLREALGQLDPSPVEAGSQSISDADLTAMRAMIDQLLNGGEVTAKGGSVPRGPRH